MDLDSPAGKLAFEIRGDYVSAEDIARIDAALRTVAAEARDAALREAMEAKTRDPDQLGHLTEQDQAIYWSGVRRKEIAIRALLATPAAPDPTMALAACVDALKAMMEGSKYESVMGMSPEWHTIRMPIREALDKARAALTLAEWGG